MEETENVKWCVFKVPQYRFKLFHYIAIVVSALCSFGFDVFPIKTEAPLSQLLIIRLKSKFFTADNKRGLYFF